MSAISHLLLTWFWWNFKLRFLGTSRTDSNCHSDICPGKICPCDICLYHKYLKCHWPNFDETLKVASWEHLEQIPTIKLTFVYGIFVLGTSVYIRNLNRCWPNFNETLKVISREYLEQIPTFKLTFDEATFVLVTFVLIRNISAVTNSILTKLLR